MTKSADGMNRFTKIVSRQAAIYGLSAGVYASHISFDIMCEGPKGLVWVRADLGEVYRTPATAARSIRKDLKAAALAVYGA